MRKVLALLLISLFWCAGAQAQQRIFTASVNVAQLPTAAAAFAASGRTPWFVRNGLTASDCSIGGGTSVVECVSDGATWTAVSTGAGSLPCVVTPLTIQFNNAGVFGCTPMTYTAGTSTLASGAITANFSGATKVLLPNLTNTRLPFQSANGLDDDAFMVWDDTNKGLHIGPASSAFNMTINNAAPPFDKASFVSGKILSSNSVEVAGIFATQGTGVISQALTADAQGSQNAYGMVSDASTSCSLAGMGCIGFRAIDISSYAEMTGTGHIETLIANAGQIAISFGTVDILASFNAVSNTGGDVNGNPGGGTIGKALGFWASDQVNSHAAFSAQFYGETASGLSSHDWGMYIENARSHLGGGLDFLSLVEGAAPSAAGGYDVCYGSSVSHTIKCSLNGGGFNDLIMATVTVSQGGTGATTLTNHSVLLGQGTSAVANTGAGVLNQCLLSGGPAADPAWGACPAAGAAAWDTITAAGANSTTNNGDFALRYNVQATTAGRVGFLFSENAASTSAGTPVLLAARAIAGSTLNPFEATFNGLGVRVNTSGVVVAVSTGGVDWPALLNYPTGCTNQFVRTIADTLTCNSVSLTADVTGVLPVANGGTNTANAPVKRAYFGFGGCNAGVAAPGWDLPVAAAMTPACKTDGGNGTVQATLQAAASNIAYATWQIPADWASFNSARIVFTTSDVTNGHTIIFNLQTACTNPNATVTDTPAYNAANAFTTVTIGGGAVANAAYNTSAGTVTGTGCAAGYILHLKLSRSGADTSTDTGIALTSGLILAYNGTYQ